MKNPRRLYRQLSPHELRIRIAGLEARAKAGRCRRTARKIDMLFEVMAEKAGSYP